jgi:hypothetical protein
MAENKLTKEKETEMSLSEIIDATNKKDPKPEHLKLLRKMMREDSSIWKTYGDWAEQTEWCLVRDYFESTEFVKENVTKKLENMRDELGWENAPEIEKLLIRQVCLTWLRLYYAERMHYQRTNQTHSFDLGIYWEKRLTLAQKRHLKAIESLAKVRKMTAQTAKLEAAASKARSAQTMNSIKILESMTKTDAI